MENTQLRKQEVKQEVKRRLRKKVHQKRLLEKRVPKKRKRRKKTKAQLRVEQRLPQHIIALRDRVIEVGETYASVTEAIDAPRDTVSMYLRQEVGSNMSKPQEFLPSKYILDFCNFLMICPAAYLRKKVVPVDIKNKCKACNKGS